MGIVCPNAPGKLSMETRLERRQVLYILDGVRRVRVGVAVARGDRARHALVGEGISHVEPAPATLIAALEHTMEDLELRDALAHHVADEPCFCGCGGEQLGRRRPPVSITQERH